MTRRLPFTALALAALLVHCCALTSPASAASNDRHGEVPVLASPLHRPMLAWQSQREHWTEYGYRDQRAALSELRSRYESAHQRGDRHEAALMLAWLLRGTAAFDVAAAGPLLSRAEAAFAQAQQADDLLAAFELGLVIETVGVQQFARAARPDRLDRLEQLAARIGGAWHDGLLWRLRGVIALQAGRSGEAYFRFQRARELIPGAVDGAEVLVDMATALQDTPTRAANHLAVAYLDQVVRLFPPERYPGLLAPVALMSQLLAGLDRPVEAVLLAQRALNAAQAVNMESALAQAYVARGHAYLAAGETRAALSDFNAVTTDALPVPDRLLAFAGRALARALGGDPRAHDDLLAGQALVRAHACIARPVLARALEHTARARQALGEPQAALGDMQEALRWRRSQAQTAQEHLAQARTEAAALQAQDSADDTRREALAGSAVLLLVLLPGLVHVWARQRRLLSSTAAAARALAGSHESLLAFDASRSRQIAAACQALQEPSTTLARLSQVDARTFRDAPARTHHLAAVRQCSATIMDMLEALLDTTRLQDGSYVPHLESFDLGDLLAEIDTQLRPLAAARRLDWQVCPAEGGIASDRRLLRRSLLNLAGHALRHAASGSVSIHVQGSAPSCSIEIRCTDPSMPDPAGMPEDGNTATALRACALLGHAVELRRLAPAGRVICIDVPHALVPGVRAGDREPASPTSRSVAIVEDDAFSRITLMNALIDAGLDAQAFASLQEMSGPSSRFSQAPPGLLITDLHLGERGDVTEGLRELRRLPAWRDVPVLLLTGDTRDEVSALAVELGVAVAYKPISVRRLLERVALLRGPQPLPQTPGARPGTRFFTLEPEPCAETP